MFFDLIMQAAAPVITPPPAGADPNITGIFGIVTACVAGVGTLVGFLKSKEGINLTGAMSLAALRKGTESKEAVLKALTSEDVKKELVKELREEIMIGVKQEETLVASKPAMDPNKLDIPREKFDTKPKI